MSLSSLIDPSAQGLPTGIPPGTAQPPKPPTQARPRGDRMDAPPANFGVDPQMVRKPPQQGYDGGEDMMRFGTLQAPNDIMGDLSRITAPGNPAGPRYTPTQPGAQGLMPAAPNMGLMNLLRSQGLSQVGL